MKLARRAHREMLLVMKSPMGAASKEVEKYAKYIDDPAGFARDVLKVELVPLQERALQCLLVHPYKVLAPSGNGQGKSNSAACAVLWWFCTRSPAVIITTAPNEKQVKDILWKEIRKLAKKAKLNLPFLPKDCRIERAPDDFAVGKTARDEASFQGQHGPNQLFIVDEACHDDQTDVMTEGGWRRFSDLDGSERLLTMNPQTLIAEYVLPVKIIKKPYRGEMIEYQCNRADWCVTPTHNMFWKKPRYNGGFFDWQLGPMEEIETCKHDLYMTRAVDWQSPDQDRFVIPAIQTDRKAFGEKSVSFDDWMEFLGWYCSEGNILTAPNGQIYGFGITQKDENTADEIFRVCERLGLKPKKYRPGNLFGAWSVRCHSMQVSRWLAQFGKKCLEKTVPDCVGRGSSRQIGVFLEAYARGDGYWKRTTRIIYTSSPRMASALQELILKAGGESVIRERQLAGKVADFGTHHGTSSVNGFVVTWYHRSRNLKYKSRNARRIQYDGHVYCASLPYHHLLLTRRNGHVLWSGNTGTQSWVLEAIEGMFSPPGHALMILFNPTKTGSWVHQELSRAEKLGGGKAYHIVRMSALEHPNIEAELNGEPPVVPDAMRLEKFERLLKKWSNLVGCKPGSSAQLATDVVWPPMWAVDYCLKTKQIPQVYRPGPLAEARLLGRFPRQGVNSVWSDGDWIAAVREGLPLLPILLDIPQIGCFVAGTLVETMNGLVAIENIKPGDMVLTRQGYKRVAASFCTGIHPTLTITCEDGRTLTGTADHPVWDGNTWVELGSLTNRDIIYTWETSKASNTTVLRGAESEQRKNNGNAITSGVAFPDLEGKQKRDTLCTGTFGKRLTARFQKECAFTTKTRTHQTTIFQTLNALAKASIVRCIQITCESSEQMFAKFAGRNTSTSPFRLGSARTNASAHGEGGAGSMTNSELAQNVGRHSYAISTNLPQLAPVRVLTKSRGKLERVYNLTVEDCPEYFANGILVHNCDVARFGDDFTSTHVRCGNKSLRHVTVNGQDTVATAKQCMDLADEFALWYTQSRAAFPPAKREEFVAITGKDIPIKIDDDGVGGSVTDQLRAAGYNVIPVSAASKPYAVGDYPNRRSELWFAVAERARAGELDLSGVVGDPKNPGEPLLDAAGNVVRMIPEATIDEIREQLLTATYKLDNRARRVVCSKDEQKAELKRSPDDADAINLSYMELPTSRSSMAEIIYSRQGPFEQRGGPRR